LPGKVGNKFSGGKTNTVMIGRIILIMKG